VRYAAPALAPLLLAAAVLARSPDVVPWSEAASHVGRVITVEGTVARARVEGGACTLEFAPDDPAAFRVVLMLSLFQAPEAPERLYAGRLIQASGRVQTFEGRAEMIIRRADQIEVLDPVPTTTTLSAPPTTTTTLPPPPPPPAAAPVPVPVPPPAVVPPTPTTIPAAAPPSVTERCAQARERLEAARRELSARSEDAARCLRSGTSRCEPERDAVARALETLPAREAEADSVCR
jgi:hypothetical protein